MPSRAVTSFLLENARPCADARTAVSMPSRAVTSFLHEIITALGNTNFVSMPSRAVTSFLQY